MKKRNLLITVLSCAILGFSFNVNAANKTVDANLCKDGKVYTNYYYFLSADRYYSEYSDRAGVYPINPLTAQGKYKNDIVLVEAAKESGIMQSNNTIKFGGQIPITNDATSGVNSKNITDFYTEFVQYLNHEGGAWTENDGVTSRMVTHSWAILTSASTYENKDYTVVVSNLSPERLVKASVNIPSSITSPSYFTEGDDKVTAFNITRNYNDSAVEAYSDDYETINVDSKDWYLNPALYYIQYCEAKENTIQAFVVRYDANGGKDAPIASETTNVGTCVNISSVKPTRSNYTFLGWSTDKNAKSADSAYAAGKCYKGTNGDLTLYAVWKGNAVDNPKTGITSHIISYVTIASLGIAGLLLARKKGLFRQI